MRHFLFSLLLLVCLLCAGCADTQGSGGTRLVALNVGKGDCLLLLCEDQSFLIDTGYEYTANLMLEALRQNGIDTLDGVFLTHCDKDHYGGLMALANSGIPVKGWYAAALYYDVEPGQHPMELAAAACGAMVQYLNAGDSLSFGSQLSLKVVGPLTRNTENENNNSLVFYVDTPDGTLLFTGDMKLEEESELLSAGVLGPAELLKVPFHGDNTASSQQFVETVMPRAALICTSSAQEPDTPASSVLKRYGKIGSTVYVTQDYDLGVVLTMQGGRITAEAIHWDRTDYSKSLRAEITPAEDLLTIYNDGAQEIQLGGWILFSTRGEECVTLPEAAVLPSGGQYTIGTRITGVPVDLQLDIKRLWHKSKPDTAILFDRTGAVAAITNNGISE